MKDEIMVSIDCTTYNHERYIEDALKGFLMQETDFEFEILIHDDKSTDKTAEIIRKYEKIYPDKIKPIYQSENQYSKGVLLLSEFQLPRARGKYIAICEGDDYWTDPHKLQKQVDYMEKNPDCTFCFHNGRVVEGDSNVEGKLVIPWLPENRKFFYDKSRKYNSGELQLLAFVPTASYMIPKKVLEDLPDWINECPVGDAPMKLIAASKGYAWYMNESMCIYRVNVPNSATDRWNYETESQKMERYNAFLKMLDNFNEYSDYKYDNEIQLSKLTWEIQMLEDKGDKEGLKDEKYKEYLKLVDGYHKLRLYIRLNFLDVYKVLKKIKNGIKNWR